MAKKQIILWAVLGVLLLLCWAASEAKASQTAPIAIEEDDSGEQDMDEIIAGADEESEEEPLNDTDNDKNKAKNEREDVKGEDKKETQLQNEEKNVPGSLTRGNKWQIGLLAVIVIGGPLILLGVHLKRKALAAAS